MMEAGRIVYDGPIYMRSRSPQISDRGDSGVSVGDLTQRSNFTQQRGAPAVYVEHLDAGYNGASVLRDISLEVKQGEFVAIMGDNGSGKTTFLQSLLGLHKPNRGRMEVLGQDTRTTPTSQLARQVGFVFQNPDHQLFAETVWKEATFAPHNFGALDARARAETEHLLARCGLGDRHGDHPYHLSYGEKRRLNVVSVLTYNPRLILLDEVLIGQDAENANFLMRLLREHVARGGTVLMVNHNPEITQCYASRLIFFERGRVKVDAPTEKAFERLADLGRWVYLPTVAQYPYAFPSSPLCHSGRSEESLRQMLDPNRCGGVVAGTERGGL
jgi:energy-coupling factor transport system ATP-binding protein